MSNRSKDENWCHSFTLLAMAEAVYPHRELVCCVSGKEPGELKCRLARLAAGRVNVLIKTGENADRLAECAPFTEGYPVPQEGETFYLCEDGACKAPVKALEECPWSVS